MRSMTGFGKCFLSENGRQVRVEAKSVNHRYLDISIRAPHLLNAAEQAVREAVKDYAARGHIDITIAYASEREGAGKAVVDMARVCSYVDAAKQIAQYTGLDNHLPMAAILQMPDVVSFETSDEEARLAAELAVRAVRTACEEMAASRAREGRALWSDISERARHLQVLSARIRDRCPAVVAEYAERLSGRIRELAQPGIEPDAQRVSQEVAIFADRCDMTEELTRIEAHIHQLLSSDTGSGARGRALDFLAQELNREFNTIGSKSQDSIISSSVIEAKAEVEKIREQIQNIE